jgi:hypothetical protein
MVFEMSDPVENRNTSLFGVFSLLLPPSAFLPVVRPTEFDMKFNLAQTPLFRETGYSKKENVTSEVGRSKSIKNGTSPPTPSREYGYFDICWSSSRSPNADSAIVIL